jgi:hypothetical protein
MTQSTLFDFFDPNIVLKKATRASTQRRSGTVADTVRHSIIHTHSPNATLHHAIIAACPHPVKARANDGEYYMVAYTSIPIAWLPALDTEFAKTWDVSFIGPAGAIQKLPPTLLEMEELLPDRVYIGFDWLWLAQENPPVVQPHYDKIKPRMIEFINALRSEFDSAWIPETQS